MLKLAVLVSGSGTTLQAIIDAINTDVISANIVQVISDRSCYALERANLYQIPTIQINRKDENFNQLLLNAVIECDLIVLAGFLSIISAELINKYKNKIINIHPSLLPKYGGSGMYGIKVHKAVLSHQEEMSGCTIHFVSDGIDTGEIIAQSKVKIDKSETPESLNSKVQILEHKLLVAVLSRWNISNQ